jgi:hypothetical protein
VEAGVVGQRERRGRDWDDSVLPPSVPANDLDVYPKPSNPPTQAIRDKMPKMAYAQGV